MRAGLRQRPAHNHGGQGDGYYDDGSQRQQGIKGDGSAQARSIIVHSIAGCLPHMRGSAPRRDPGARSGANRLSLFAQSGDAVLQRSEADPKHLGCLFAIAAHVIEGQ